MQVRTARRWWWDALVLGIAIAIGILAAAAPWLALGVTVVAILANLAWHAAPRLPLTFAASLGILLAGYAFLDRGFAHIGVGSLYVGELVLATGLAAALLSRSMRVVPRSATAWLWVAFALWCAARTAPYVHTYGVDAFHDAALWVYGVFMLLVAAALAQPQWAERVPRFFARIVPWFLLWIPLAGVLVRVAPQLNVTLPGSAKPLLGFSASDAGAHLGGIGVFLLLGLYATNGVRAGRHRRWPMWLLWGSWLVGFFLVTIWSRGGALAAFAALLIVVLARPDVSARSAGLIVALVVTVLLAAVAANFSVNVGGYRGQISASEVAGSALSTVGLGAGQREQRNANATWRLLWWRKIIAYTIHGDRFWTGKGFGINLADDDGFQVERDHSLRNPHNGHLTVLARAGVPGLALWSALLVSFAATMIGAYVRARRARQERWARVNLWILCYWVAFLVTATFDVFLEGPHGGIWFWSLMGYGLAVVAQQRRAPARPVLSIAGRP